MAKDSPRITAGELQKIVESRGQKTFLKKKKKKRSNSPYITTCCLGGFQENFSSLIQKQNSSIFSYQTRLELQMGLASMVR